MTTTERTNRMTTTTDPDAPVEAPTRPELLEPKTAGIGGYGRNGTIALFAAGIVGAFVWKIAGLWIGLVYTVVGLVVLGAIFLTDHAGQSNADKVRTKLAWRRGQAMGTNQFLSGPTTPLGDYKLPGYLATSELTDHVDVNGTPYSFVRIPEAGTLSVAFEVHPDGVENIDPKELARFKDGYAAMLNMMATRAPAVQLQVIVESEPATNHGLQRRLDAAIDPGAPAAALSLIKELGSGARKAADVRFYVTVTFTDLYAGQKRSLEQVAQWLATELPTMMEEIGKAGAGHCVPLTGQDLCEIVRVEYDPACGDYLAQAHADGAPIMMLWSSIGPPAADDQEDRYEHSSGVSRSWSMVDHHGQVSMKRLNELLQPHPDIARKRVAFIYSLRGPAHSPTVAARDERAADFNATKERQTGTDRRQQKIARANADKEATGAALLDIAIVVTATVLRATEGDPVKGRSAEQVTDDRLQMAEAAVMSLGPTARLALRDENGKQAAAFALSMPVGLVAARLSQMKITTRVADAKKAERHGEGQKA